jgi:hypothetical protein
VPNAAQNLCTVDGILPRRSKIPSAGALIAIVALWFYPLDETP